MCRRFVLRLGHRFSKIYGVILRKQALKNRLCSSTLLRLRRLETQTNHVQVIQDL